jgi:hypothetical protein
MQWYFETSVRDSMIHGKGRFANTIIPKGQLVVNIYGNIYKNENNSYVNHSLANNIDWDGNNGWIANKDIEIDEEITMNYSQWIKQQLPF